MQGNLLRSKMGTVERLYSRGRRRKRRKRSSGSRLLLFSASSRTNFTVAANKITYSQIILTTSHSHSHSFLYLTVTEDSRSGPIADPYYAGVMDLEKENATEQGKTTKRRDRKVLRYRRDGNGQEQRPTDLYPLRRMKLKKVIFSSPISTAVIFLKGALLYGGI